MSEVKVKLGADLSSYYEELKKAEGVTESQLQAMANAVEDARVFDALTENLAKNSKMSINEAKRTAKIIIAEEKKIAAASAAAAKESANARIAAEKQKQEAVTKGLTVTFGGIVGDLEDLDGMLSQVGTSGTATFGAIGAAAGIMGAAVLAEIAAITGVVSVLYEMADATGKLEEEKQVLNSAFETLTTTIGDRYAPEFERTLLLAAGLVVGVDKLVTKLFELEDAFYKVLISNNDFRAAMALLTAGSTEQFIANRRLQESFEKLGVAEGSLTDQAQKAADQKAKDAKRAEDIHNAAMGFQQEATQKRKEAADQEKKTEAERGRLAEQRMRERVTAEQQLRATIDASNRELLDDEERLSYEYTKRLEQINEQEKASGNHALAEEARAAAAATYLKDAFELGQKKAAEKKRKDDADKAAEDKAAEADAERRRQAIMEEQEAAAQRAAAIREYTDTGISAAVTLAQAVADSAKDGTKAQKDAAMVAFRISQAGSLATIAMNTAEGVSKALALNPPPSPLGAIGAAIVTASGLAQAATVAAQPPPSFHTGGMISTNPLAPDETMVVARKGEEIRTRQDQSANAPVVVQMTYQHRVFDTFVADNMKQTSSPLRREISSRSGRLLGHRERAR